MRAWRTGVVHHFWQIRVARWACGQEPSKAAVKKKPNETLLLLPSLLGAVRVSSSPCVCALRLRESGLHRMLAPCVPPRRRRCRTENRAAAAKIPKLRVAGGVIYRSTIFYSSTVQGGSEIDDRKKRVIAKNGWKRFEAREPHDSGYGSKTAALACLRGCPEVTDGLSPRGERCGTVYSSAACAEGEAHWAHAKLARQAQ
jgi:hypothetical protein